jgi:hypothetical protein
VRRRTVDGCIAVGGLGSFVADHLCVVRLQLDEPWGATEAVAGTGQEIRVQSIAVRGGAHRSVYLDIYAGTAVPDLGHSCHPSTASVASGLTVAMARGFFAFFSTESATERGTVGKRLQERGGRTDSAQQFTLRVHSGLQRFRAVVYGPQRPRSTSTS